MLLTTGLEKALATCQMMTQISGGTSRPSKDKVRQFNYFRIPVALCRTLSCCCANSLPSSRLCAHGIHETSSALGIYNEESVSSSTDSSPGGHQESVGTEQRLESWKAIAAYLGREVRTVQRWEKTESLPIHRHHHAKLGSVFAFASELRQWQNSRRNLMVGSEIGIPKNSGESPLPSIQIAAAASSVSRNQPRSRSRRAIILGVGALCLLATFLSFIVARRESPTSYEPVFLTTYEGRQYSPSFSPDGSSIAYSWRRPSQDAFQIYTEVIGSSKPLCLTEGPGDAFRPAWSPDGKRIAFLRSEDGQTGLWLYSVSNHAAWRIRQLPGAYEPIDMTLSWTPDAMGLIVPENNSPARPGGLFYVPVSGLDDVRLTHPQGAQGDPNATVSLDGRELVFTRFFANGVSHLLSLTLSTHYQPVGSPKPIRWSGFQGSSTSEPSFMGTDRNLLFLATFQGRWQIWKSHNFEQPTLAGVPAAKISGLTVSAKGHRLAYSVNRSDSNIWRLDALALLQNHQNQPEEIIASTELDQRPQVSPDGLQLAFESDRSGANEIWTSNLKTGENFQVTHFNSGGTGSPSWSPDQKNITFDARLNGQVQIYTIPASGGTAKPLTFDDSTNFLPTWSNDGRSIYFSSSRSGTFQIWRVSASGGPPEQITQKGGFDCRMSDDGAFLYYVNSNRNGGLWRVPSAGGSEIPIIAILGQRAFALAPDGVFFVPQGDRQDLRYLGFGTGKSRLLYTFQRPLVFPISFDGHFLYFSQYDSFTNNLMLVDHFR